MLLAWTRLEASVAFLRTGQWDLPSTLLQNHLATNIPYNLSMIKRGCVFKWNSAAPKCQELEIDSSHGLKTMMFNPHFWFLILKPTIYICKAFHIDTCCLFIFFFKNMKEKKITLQLSKESGKAWIWGLNGIPPYHLYGKGDSPSKEESWAKPSVQRIELVCPRDSKAFCCFVCFCCFETEFH